MAKKDTKLSESLPGAPYNQDHHSKTMSPATGKQNNKGRVKRGKRVGRRWTPEPNAD